MMKSTYKLVGALWDHMPADFPLEEAPLDGSMLPAGSPMGLFDFEGKRRCVKLSQILAFQSREEVDSFLGQLADCSEVGLILDYKPRSESPIHQEFFRKRVKQVLTHMDELLPGSRISAMAPAATGGRRAA